VLFFTRSEKEPKETLMADSVLTQVFSTKNLILNSLFGSEFEHLMPHLEYVELPQGKILYEAEEKIGHIYFPSNGMISVVNTTSEGDQTEVSVIGSEGFSGIEGLLDGPQAINRYIVQLPGTGHRIAIQPLKLELSHDSSFQVIAHKFMRSILAQVSQTALCNRLHKNEKRLAKRLLMCHDRFDGDVLPITQEFAAVMLGANRTTVTVAAGNLQDEGFIRYARGKVTIVDRAGLEDYSCECYQKITAEYARLVA
jgi:CRP-like cAMP-binding protein